MIEDHRPAGIHDGPTVLSCDEEEEKEEDEE